MRLTVTQQAGERREVHPIRHKIQRLHGGYRSPLVRQKARVDPRRDRSNTGQLAINGDLRLTEGRVSTSVNLVDAGEVVREAAKPLLIGSLALGYHIQIRLLGVGRQRKGRRELVGRRRQRGRQVDSTASIDLKQRQYLVRRPLAAALIVVVCRWIK